MTNEMAMIETAISRGDRPIIIKNGRLSTIRYNILRSVSSSYEKYFFKFKIEITMNTKSIKNYTGQLIPLYRFNISEKTDI